MKIYIKNMVSKSCILFLKNALSELGIDTAQVRLGEIEIEEDLPYETKQKLISKLREADLELLDKKHDIIVEKIKHVIIDYIYKTEEAPIINFSDLLSEKLNYNYNYLSNLFLKGESITITQYIIKLRIERIKELLLLDEYSLTEIAYKLHYSSCAHLSNQFKKVTGLAPSHFQQLNENRRLSIQDV